MNPFAVMDQQIECSKGILTLGTDVSLKDSAFRNSIRRRQRMEKDPGTPRCLWGLQPQLSWGFCSKVQSFACTKLLFNSKLGLR